jgi:hypothetical protein
MGPLLLFTGLCVLVNAGDSVKFGFLPPFMYQDLHLDSAVRGAVNGIQPRAALRRKIDLWDLLRFCGTADGLSDTLALLRTPIFQASLSRPALHQAKDKIRLDSGGGNRTAELRPNGQIEIFSVDDIKLITGESSITLNHDGTIIISGKLITICGTDEASLGVGSQNVKCDTQQVATSGAAINSVAMGKHVISGAVVKLN